MLLANGGGGESSGLLLALPILLLVLFYFVAIRPQQRQRRQVADVQAKLEPGLEVMTGAGLLGTVKRLEDDQVVLEIASGVEVRFLRQSIVRVIEPNVPNHPPDDESTGPSTS